MEKKSNNGIFVVIGIVLLICILCTCVSAIGFIAYQASNKVDVVDNGNLDLNFDDLGFDNIETTDIDFETLMSNYISDIDAIQLKWDTSDVDCYTEEQRDELMTGDFLLDEFLTNVDESKDLVDQEWNCYKSIWEEELAYNENLESELSNIVCSELVGMEDDCENFKTEIAMQTSMVRELIPIITDDYEQLKQLYNCYGDTFETYLNDTQEILDANYKICESNYDESENPRMEELKNAIGDSWEKTYFIAEDYLY